MGRRKNKTGRQSPQRRAPTAAKLKEEARQPTQGDASAGLETRRPQSPPPIAGCSPLLDFPDARFSSALSPREDKHGEKGSEHGTPSEPSSCSAADAEHEHDAEAQPEDEPLATATDSPLAQPTPLIPEAREHPPLPLASAAREPRRRPESEVAPAQPRAAASSASAKKQPVAQAGKAAASASGHSRGTPSAGSSSAGHGARDKMLNLRRVSIWEPVLDGDIEEVARQLARGADIDEVRDEGRTPLMLACAAGDARMVDFLLRPAQAAAGQPDPAAWQPDLEARRPNFEARAIAGWTPLMVAAGAGYLEIVRALLRAGASASARDSEFGATPLTWACGGGHQEVVRYFLREVPCTAEDLNARNLQQWTPLMVAADGGHLETVKLLVGEGARLDLYNSDACTALDLARASRDKVVESFLRRAGARGGEDFWVAVDAADVETVAATLSANPHLAAARDKDGRTALLLACQTGDMNLVKLLVEAGSKVDFRDASGTSPLHVAVMVGGLPMVKYLVAASRREKEREKTTERSALPLSSSSPSAGGGGAAAGGFSGSGSSSHAVLEIATAAGWTPLMQAVQCGGDVDLVRFLVDNGAGVNACCKDGQTVLDVARRAGRGPLAEYLVSKGAFSGNEVRAQIDQVKRGQRWGGFPLW